VRLSEIHTKFVHVSIAQKDKRRVTWRWTHILDKANARLCARQMRRKGCTVVFGPWTPREHA
jgi:hypothetical protein